MSRKLVIDLATHLGWADIIDNEIADSGNLNLEYEWEWEYQVLKSKKRKTLPTIILKNEEDNDVKITWVKPKIVFYDEDVSTSQIDKYFQEGKLWFINHNEDPNSISKRTIYVEIDGTYHLVKPKLIKTKLTLKEQLKKLSDFIKGNSIFIDELIVELPAVPFGAININSLRKQFGLYSIVELASNDGIDKEIAPNEWFKWIINEFPPYNVFNENKNKERKIDRKKTSKLIANVIMKDIYGLDKEIKDDNEADAICIAYYEIKNGEE